jgi:hypothetical protein
VVLPGSGGDDWNRTIKVRGKADCIVGVYWDWWVYNAKCIVGIYSDWVYNAKCIVGTEHRLKTMLGTLWVNNRKCIVGVSGNHNNSVTRVQRLSSI